MTLSLRTLPGRLPDWDRVVLGYPSKTLFHESCWLDHVASLHANSRLVYAAVQDAGATSGYFVGVRRRFGIVPVLGSPLPGTGTNYLGPLVGHDVRLADLVRAVVRWCRRSWILHFELAHPWLDALHARDIGLEAHPDVTHVVTLSHGPDAVWDALKGTCRNRVRKAEKNGLEAELTADPQIVDHFCEQYVEVYAKQGLVPPYGPDRPRSLYEHLMPAGRLLPVWVKYKGEVAACGLFPFDENAVYFWGASSWLRFHHLCPNELLHWTVMKLAMERGIPLYNMCGGTSRFKDKFGGSDVPYVKYSHSLAPGLATARHLYEAFFRARLRWRGRLTRADRLLERTEAPSEIDA